jgi:hypothetical protein
VFNISDHGVFVALLWQAEPVFDMFFNLMAIAFDDSTNAPSYFSLYADVNLEAMQYVEQHITSLLTTMQTSLRNAADEAKAKLASWEQDNGAALAADTDKVTSLQNAISADKASAEAKIAQEIDKLDSAKAYVASINASIAQHEQAMRTCRHWYDAGCHAHNLGESTAIFADRVKMATHEAAQSVAEASLKTLGWVEGVGYDADKELNPKILALRAAIAARNVLNTSETALEDAISVAEGATNDVLKAMLDIVGAIFSLESITIETASTAGIKGETITLSVNG